MTEGASGSRIRFWIGYAVIALSFGLFAIEAVQSSIFNPERRAERMFVQDYVKTNAPDAEMEGRLAEAYWTRYPHIRADDVFGPAGMGIAGARAHYDRHGRFEGLRWGLN